MKSLCWGLLCCKIQNLEKIQQGIYDMEILSHAGRFRVLFSMNKIGCRFNFRRRLEISDSSFIPKSCHEFGINSFGNF